MLLGLSITPTMTYDFFLSVKPLQRETNAKAVLLAAKAIVEISFTFEDEYRGGAYGAVSTST